MHHRRLVDAPSSVFVGTEQFVTHRPPLSEAQEACARFRDQADGMVEVVLTR